MFVAFSSPLPAPSSLLKVMQMKSFCLIFRKYLPGGIPGCLLGTRALVVWRTSCV